MFITPTDTEEILSIVVLLKPNASPDYDSISLKVVRKCISHIGNFLCDIFNTSLLSGVFPDGLKLAKVIPIYKADDRLSVSNYRSISVLPFFKNFGKMKYNRLLSFRTASNILANNQYGFRKNHSTYITLLNLVDQITIELDNKQFSLGIFIDLSKEFDTLDHEILISK